WGYYDVLFKGREFKVQRPYGSYVMENILFKISYPAEFHAQTAIEAGMTLHAEVKDRIADIEKVVVETQEAGAHIIDKAGPLENPADRDHCIQYMVAVPMIFGRLTAADYEDPVANDPRIDELRDKMTVIENEQFTREYFDPALRYIGNAVQVFFKDGTSTNRIEVNVPAGHRERREEGVPAIKQKFVDSVSPKLAASQWTALDALCANRDKLAATPVDDFMALLVA
ncbi:MAG: MmgE/PrpD family protein, partial [Gammaproteobacteria bacterium]|nr:MmgE/PrpD family protein [Gammaproteobacteria bacterium]NNL52369.1 2-methylcitrate dehydratase [Woeseiaceae bacterium]